MSRPIKKGLDYFPLDVAMNTKVNLIEAEFGIVGFAVVVKLFQKIYGEQGYYCEWTKEVALLFSRNVGLGNNVVSEIVCTCVKRGIFDKAMFENEHILTSAGIQKRYLAAKRTSDFSKIEQSYLLLTLPSNTIIAAKKGIIETEKGVNAAKSTQRKENKSKVNKSKKERSLYDEILASVDNQALRDMYYEFLKMRKLIKAPMTDRALQMLIKKVCGMAADEGTQIKILEQSIVNNWKGVYPLKADTGGQAAKPSYSNKFNDFSQRKYTEEEFKEIIERKGGI